ncbi:hypothetical protein [Photobacterium satsumensis]|uniref:hypothetical protein n=1 Tax=Photobacterium satsumensis TaxID=2910239 RepID=UPI003D0DF3A5
MNNFNKKIIVGLILSLPLCANADDTKQPDPADVTKVRTAVTLAVNDDTSGKFSVDLSGKYNAKYSYMVKGEAGWNDDQEYSDARFQFYNVANTGFAAVPKTAISYDYFRMAEDSDELDVQMHALGSISMVPISKEWRINLFPQLTYLQSTFDTKFPGAEQSRKADGVMAVAYMSKHVGTDGSYFMLYPEYFKVSGDGVEYEQKNINLAWGSPITNNKKWWYIIEYMHKENDTSFDGVGPGVVKDDIVNFKIRRFFF